MPLNKMRSIHDNNVFAINIHCEKKKIILHTEYYEGEDPEYTDVVFVNAIAHFFEHIWKGNILYGIEEFNPIDFYNDYESRLRFEHKYGFPISIESADIFSSEMHDKNLKTYIIDSSYGMSGWVICLKIKLRAKANKEPLA